MATRREGESSWRRYGLGLGAFLVGYGVLFRLLGLDSASPLTWLFYLAQPVALVWLTRSESKRPGLTRLRRVGISAAAAALGNSMYAIYVYLFNRFVDDSLIRDTLSSQLAALEASGLPAVEMARRAADLERAFTPLTFSVNVFIALMLVALGSALLLLAWPVVRPEEG